MCDERQIVFIAYRDVGDEMEPVTRRGQLLTFPSFEAAQDAAGILGVGAAMAVERLPGLRRQYGLDGPAQIPLPMGG